MATIPVSLSYQCISSTSMINSKIYYLLEEHDGPSSESYILKSAYFDINTWQFEMPVQLPHPSTLASKWCTLVFPQEFLERYQTQTSLGEDDLSLALDEGRSSIARRRQPSSKSLRGPINNEASYSYVYDTINYASMPSPTSRLNNQEPSNSGNKNESKFDLYLVRDQIEETDDDDAQTICGNRQMVSSTPSSPSSNSTELHNTYRAGSSSRNSNYDTLLTQINRTKFSASSSAIGRSSTEIARMGRMNLYAGQSTPGLDATYLYATGLVTSSEEACSILSTSCENLPQSTLQNIEDDTGNNL